MADQMRKGLRDWIKATRPSRVAAGGSRATGFEAGKNIDYRANKYKRVIKK
jgi:hypothetical protein